MEGKKEINMFPWICIYIFINGQAKLGIFSEHMPKLTMENRWPVSLLNVEETQHGAKSLSEIEEIGAFTH